MFGLMTVKKYKKIMSCMAQVHETRITNLIASQVEDIQKLRQQYDGKIQKLQVRIVEKNTLIERQHSLLVGEGAD